MKHFIVSACLVTFLAYGYHRFEDGHNMNEPGPKLIEVLPSTVNRAGATTTSSSFLLGHGVSVVATITNGDPGPKNPCFVSLELSADNISFYPTNDIRMATAFAKAIFTTRFELDAEGVRAATGFNLSDFKYGRLVFKGNTGRSVTVSAEG